ncbi:MAG: posphoenolpyruvate synthetase regulatory kinase/phosphorylase PpsR, partial [Woeseiaceae bacterium]
VYFLSDQTGVTAEALGHSLITQFAGQNFRQMTLPFIDSEDKAREAVRTINTSSSESVLKPIVFSTLVQPNLRAIVKEAEGLHLDIFDAFLQPLADELEDSPTLALGGAHGMSDIDTYMRRIEATNFALSNDDGGVSRNYEMADVILVGVSRSGKTPTCLYLALQYGVYAANYPLTDEELETGKLPAFLASQKKKLYGLTISPTRLQQIRKERRPMGRYSSAQQVRFELRESAKIFRRYGIPHVDTTEFSIEEISSRILDSTGVERRVRP